MMISSGIDKSQSGASMLKTVPRCDTGNLSGFFQSVRTEELLNVLGCIRIKTALH